MDTCIHCITYMYIHVHTHTHTHTHIVVGVCGPLGSPKLVVEPKDHIPPQQRAGVVYRIPCVACPKVYVGQTSRSLEHRLMEHKRALTSRNLTQSAVMAEHATHESHAINWKEAKVVDNQPRYHQMFARVLAQQIRDHHHEQR